MSNNLRDVVRLRVQSAAVSSRISPTSSAKIVFQRGEGARIGYEPVGPLQKMFKCADANQRDCLGQKTLYARFICKH